VGDPPRRASAEGEAMYQKAKAADDAGKASSAIKKYKLVADKYPFAPSAAQARFRQAELLEQNGARVTGFYRLAVGEGIEKKEENFADEVMQQVSGG